MPLVPCYECGSHISDRAPACPRCGAPKESPKAAPDPTFPDLAADLSVGRMITNWNGCEVCPGIFYADESEVALPVAGPVSVCVYERGLALTGSGITIGSVFWTCHYSLIVSVVAGAAREEQSASGSVAVSAVVGAAIAGPVGAIVGGMAGMKPKKTTDGFLAITFWDVESRRQRTLRVACILANAQRFADKYRERSSAGTLKDLDGRGGIGSTVLFIFLVVCLAIILGKIFAAR